MRFRRSRKRTITYTISMIMIWVLISYPFAQRNAQAQIISYVIVSNEREYYLGEYIYFYTKERPGFLKALNRTLYYNLFRRNDSDSGWYFFDGPCGKPFTTNADGEGAFIIGPIDSRYFGPGGKITVQIDTEYRCGAVSPPTMIAYKNIIVNHYPFKFTVNKTEVEPGELVTFRITGARPNQPIRHKQWLNGNPIDDHFYGHYTDANGNWSETIGPYPASRAGNNMIQVTVGSTESTEKPNLADHRSVAFRLLAGPKGSFEVIPNQAPLPPGGTHVFQIRNAPPNQPIKWSSWINGIPVEYKAFYGSYTDAQGNWEQTLGPYTGLTPGIWTKKAHIGDREYSQTFIINQVPAALPTLPGITYAVSEVQQDPQTGEWFVDFNVHAQMNNQPLDQDPIFDFSGRSWFREVPGALASTFEPTSFDIGKFDIFLAVPTGGNICFQQHPSPTPIPTPHPSCFECVEKFKSDCRWDGYFGVSRGLTEGILATLACAYIGKEVVLGGPTAIAVLVGICIGVGMVFAVSSSLDELGEYRDCMCGIPNACTNSQRDCARVFVGVAQMKALCGARIITK
jgi:hypothetical protein